LENVCNIAQCLYKYLYVTIKYSTMLLEVSILFRRIGRIGRIGTEFVYFLDGV